MSESSTSTTTASSSPSETKPKFADLVSVSDIKVGDELAIKVNERTNEVLGKTIKVDTLTYGRKALYAFVNRRYRYDMGGYVHRVA
jgi:hypothetical protein